VSQLPGKFILHSVLERTDRGVARAVCGSEIKVVNSLKAVLSDSEVDLVSSRLLSGVSAHKPLPGGDCNPRQHPFRVCKSGPDRRQAWYVETLVALATPSFFHSVPKIYVAPVVLVEKPVCIHAADAIELNQLARARGRILSVYQNRRWDSDFLTVKKVISSGQVGRLALSGVLLITASWEH
jgi:hypothetical protein